MPKLSTEKIFIGKGTEEETLFSYDINVSVEGLFYTNLPKNVVELFTKAGLDLDRSRRGKLGYISAKLKDELIKEIKKLCEEYMSKELISEKTVIRYEIRTQCHYCLDSDKNIVPNGGYAGDKAFQEYGWRVGTAGDTPSWQSGTPYGFLIYAEPLHKKVYRYKSGKEKTEYEKVDSHFKYPKPGSKGYYLHWLNSLVHLHYEEERNVQEVEYTEKTAKLFVELIVGICALNEKIKDILNPESILKIANSENFKLLGNG